MALSHVALRLFAAIANCTIVLYIYIGHMSGFDRSRFCSAGNPRRVVDYLRQGEIDPIFDYLRTFTFSEAMLQHLDVFMLIGTPVAFAYLFVEYKRIRWLQGLIQQLTPSEQEKRALVWLEAYLWIVSSSFLFVLLLGYYHLDLPRGHYIVAATAFSCQFTGQLIYLYAPLDYKSLAAKAAKSDVVGISGHETEFSLWAARVQTWVLPCLKFVVFLQIAATLAGMWKAQALEDSRAALLFGVLETSVIFAYQVFIAAFAVDDIMMGKSQKPLLGQKFGLGQMVKLGLGQKPMLS